MDELRRYQDISGSSGAERQERDSRFWDSTRSIVTELPRSVLAEGRVSSTELVQDRTLPPYRT